MVERAGANTDAERSPATLGLEAVYRAEARRVATWIQRLDPAGDTEDLLHEVFLVVRRRLPEFRGESSLGTWLHAITTRVVIAARRKRRLRRFLLGREESGLRDDHAAPRTPEQALARRELGHQLYELLDELSERDRSLLILHELDGLTGVELARVAGISEGGVWVALHRARTRLRKAYVARYGERSTP